MSNPDNGNIDKFFQKALKQPDIGFRESDWKKMEERLNALDGRVSHVKSRRTKMVLYAASAVALCSLLFYMNKQAWMSQKETTESGKSEGSSQTEIAKEKMDAASQVVSSPPVPSGTEATLPLQNIQPLHLLTSEKNGVRSQQINASLPDGVDRSNKNIAERNESPAGYSQIHIKDILPEPLAHIRPWSPENVDLVKVPTVVIAEPKQNETKLSRWSIVAAVAPDFSAAGFENFASPGSAFGLAGHYHVSRLSFSVGLWKSNKVYKGKGEYYKPSPNYWKNATNGVVPESVDGSCSVLEIPALLQYKVVEWGKGKVLVAGGVSSYIMLKESYQYNFEQPNPGANSGWDSHKKEHNMFRILHFSIAYEHRIHPKLAMGLEPYVKVPISGIGWANLDLFSTGVSVSLRYRPPAQ